METAWLLLLNCFLWFLRATPGNTFPRPLSREEERDYLRRWAEGDLEARNKLVEHNLRLVAHIVKKYYAQTDDVEDLISVGTIGLIKGINTYKPDKGVKLSSYVSRCIENEILMVFRGNRKSASDLSLSEALDVEDEGGGLSMIDVIAEDSDLAEQLGDREICAHLREAVDSELTEREALIIRVRYGLNGQPPVSQRQAAELCGISRSYVSRIEKKALQKLRAVMGEDARPG